MSNEQPPSFYDYVASPDRRPLRFPNGARLALIITINLEYWEKFRPGQKEPLFTGGPMTIPHALPGDVWDSANWSWREYGQRVGVWRLIDMFDGAGVKPSCTVNGLSQSNAVASSTQSTSAAGSWYRTTGRKMTCSQITRPTRTWNAPLSNVPWINSKK